LSNTIDILVAEDEEHIAKLIAFKLNKEGYRVTIAKNGQEAIELLAKQSWKLLILDVMMPVMDGFAVLKTVRWTPALAELPVLLLTAKGKGESPDMAGLRVEQYLKKPFDPAHLAQVVKSMVGS
jgi:DNA-binding response OmpR family regulator